MTYAPLDLTPLTPEKWLIGSLNGCEMLFLCHITATLMTSSVIFISLDRLVAQWTLPLVWVQHKKLIRRIFVERN